MPGRYLKKIRRLKPASPSRRRLAYRGYPPRSTPFDIDGRERKAIATRWNYVSTHVLRCFFFKNPYVRELSLMHASPDWVSVSSPARLQLRGHLARVPELIAEHADVELGSGRDISSHIP